MMSGQHTKKNLPLCFYTEHQRQVPLDIKQPTHINSGGSGRRTAAGWQGGAGRWPPLVRETAAADPTRSAGWLPSSWCAAGCPRRYNPPWALSSACGGQRGSILPQSLRSWWATSALAPTAQTTRPIPIAMALSGTRCLPRARPTRFPVRDPPSPTARLRGALARCLRVFSYCIFSVLLRPSFCQDAGARSGRTTQWGARKGVPASTLCAHGAGPSK